MRQTKYQVKQGGSLRRDAGVAANEAKGAPKEEAVTKVEESPKAEESDAEEETPEGAVKVEVWKDGNEDGILVGSEERIAEGSPEGSREGKSVGVAEGRFDCSNEDRDMGVRKVPKRVLKTA